MCFPFVRQSLEILAVHSEHGPFLIDTPAFKAISQTVSASDQWSSSLCYSSSLGLGAVVNDLLGPRHHDDAMDKKVDLQLALITASVAGKKDVVLSLIERGADVNATGQVDLSALVAASSVGRDDVVKLLLERRADPDILCEFETFELGIPTTFVGSAIWAASFNGHLKAVKLLLRSGANVNAMAQEHGNALVPAIRRGREAVFHLLLQHGCCRDTSEGPGSALRYAIY